MGWAFVKRRMARSLAPTGRRNLPIRASSGGGRLARPGASRPRARRRGAACKLQYPDMQSAVEADLQPAAVAVRDSPALGSGHRHQRDRPGDRRAPSRGARLQPRGEARRALPAMLKDDDSSACRMSGPSSRPAVCSRSTGSTGRKLLEHKDDTLAARNRLATAMFTAWWFPFSRFGVIHGDPHLGNYTVFDDARENPPASICSTMAASGFSRRASSAAWSISIADCCTAMTISWCMPTRPGASSISAAN